MAQFATTIQSRLLTTDIPTRDEVSPFLLFIWLTEIWHRH